MNFSSEERWLAIRQLHEVHAVPIELLAIISGLKPATISMHARKGQWVGETQEKFDPRWLETLVGKLVTRAGQMLDELLGNVELSPASRIQLQSMSALAATLQKILVTQRGVVKNSARSGNHKAANEPTNTGEDILALRQDVEAFIDAIGEEEIDPQISAEPE